MDLQNISLKELASLVYELLRDNDVDAVLVGGACVSIYSENKYQSYDLDFVTYAELNKVNQILSQIGFKRKGRSFKHEQCPYLIDFVNPPIAVGHEAVRHFEQIKTCSGMLKLLSPIDCVKDRLSSYFHWDDKQALEQAIMVAGSHSIDLKNIERWAKEEGYPEKFKNFLQKMRKLPPETKNKSGQDQ